MAFARQYCWNPEPWNDVCVCSVQYRVFRGLFGVLCSLRGVSTVVYCVLRYLCNTIYLDVCSVRRRRVFISCDVEVH